MLLYPISLDLAVIPDDLMILWSLNSGIDSGVNQPWVCKHLVPTLLNIQWNSKPLTWRIENPWTSRFFSYPKGSIATYISISCNISMEEGELGQSLAFRSRETRTLTQRYRLHPGCNRVCSSVKRPDYFNGNIDLEEVFFIKTRVYLPWVNSVKRGADIVRGFSCRTVTGTGVTRRRFS